MRANENDTTFVIAILSQTKTNALRFFNYCNVILSPCLYCQILHSFCLEYFCHELIAFTYIFNIEYFCHELIAFTSIFNIEYFCHELIAFTYIFNIEYFCHELIAFTYIFNIVYCSECYVL